MLGLKFQIVTICQSRMPAHTTAVCILGTIAPVVFHTSSIGEHLLGFSRPSVWSSYGVGFVMKWVKVAFIASIPYQSAGLGLGSCTSQAAPCSCSWESSRCWANSLSPRYLWRRSEWSSRLLGLAWSSHSYLSPFKGWTSRWKISDSLFLLLCLPKK